MGKDLLKIIDCLGSTSIIQCSKTLDRIFLRLKCISVCRVIIFFRDYNLAVPTIQLVTKISHCTTNYQCIFVCESYTSACDYAKLIFPDILLLVNISNRFDLGVIFMDQAIRCHAMVKFLLNLTLRVLFQFQFTYGFSPTFQLA